MTTATLAATDHPHLNRYKTETDAYGLDRFKFYSDTPLYSTARFPLDVRVGTAQSLFYAPVGEVGQGFSAGLTHAETSLQRGYASGRFPQNVAYAASGLHFSLTRETSDGRLLKVLPEVAARIGAACQWVFRAAPKLKVETLHREPVGLWLQYNGRAFQSPLFFPPGDRVSFKVEFLHEIHAVDLGWDAGDSLRICANLTGCYLTQIV